ncbi:ROK family transcriptional regulator [Sphingobium sufflavum]|uniref:ROK family transcriptional regulator n=1 Tax=Sphingobium sufflavum TaxID=1129547 RepID=UPI001F3882F8|nr:ROK family transcriptional regulator [Sphingobium sufflavum]MCE7796397.1 ROK family transcriptional regulator [Sphingobium sufflavum]
MIDPDQSKLRALKLIRRTEGLSRIELAKALGFNKATVTDLVADLLRRDLLVEEKGAAAGRGRPRTHLSINASAGYVISVSPLMGERASIDIVDLKGSRIHSCETVLAPFDDVEALPDMLSGVLGAVLDEEIVPRAAIRYAAIVLPGLVNHRDGIVHWLPSSKTAMSVPLARQMEERVGIPVILDNRVAAIARAEHWFGSEGNLDSFTLIALLEQGMNAARYVEGRMQIGHNGMNSEFSHVKVAFEGGRPCYCGSSGCITAYASVSGIGSALARLRGIGLSDWSQRTTAFEEAVRLTAAKEEGEVAGLFATAGEALGTAIASHINEHDPGRVIVVSARPDLLSLMRRHCEERVDSSTLPILRERTSVEYRTVRPDEYWKGTAALALEGVYRAPSS